MKLFIITDIHGSKKYLDLALAKYKEDTYNKLVILGDILYHGPRNNLPEDYDTKYVYNTLNQYKDQILAIKGNCDADVDEFVLDFPLFPEVLLNIGGKQVLFIHGEKMQDLDFDSWTIVGHYHINKLEDNIIYLGSLSLPKDGVYSYAVIEDKVYRAYDLLTNKCILEVAL